LVTLEKEIMPGDSEHNNFAVRSNTIIRFNSQQVEALQLRSWAETFCSEITKLLIIKPALFTTCS
jgi:hypothetical protein